MKLPVKVVDPYELFEPWEQITLAKAGVIFVAYSTWIYCVCALGAIAFASFYATWNYFTPGIFFDYKDEYQVTLVMMFCWLMFFLVLGSVLIQGVTAYNLLRSTHLPANRNPTAATLSLTWCWEHQNFQIKMILAEALACMTIVVLIHTSDNHDANNLAALQLMWGGISKVFLGRVLFAVIVVLYIFEQHKDVQTSCCDKCGSFYVRELKLLSKMEQAFPVGSAYEQEIYEKGKHVSTA